MVTISPFCHAILCFVASDPRLTGSAIWFGVGGEELGAAAAVELLCRDSERELGLASDPGSVS